MKAANVDADRDCVKQSFGWIGRFSLSALALSLLACGQQTAPPSSEILTPGSPQHSDQTDSRSREGMLQHEGGVPNPAKVEAQHDRTQKALAGNRKATSDDSDESVCKAVLQEYVDRPIPDSVDLCTVVPLQASKNFTRPNWRRLNAAENLDLIGQYAVRREWGWALSNDYVNSKATYFRFPDGYKKYGPATKPTLIPPEIITEIWTPLLEDVRQLITEEKIWIDVADFDLNNDGDLDKVYRISPIPFKKVAPPVIRSK